MALNLIRSPHSLLAASATRSEISRSATVRAFYLACAIILFNPDAS
jgi:hypothetical protein